MSPNLAPGARQLPLRHISIRVPWNDTNWTGLVCQKPKENTSCMILKRIRGLRNDEKETHLAGKSWQNLEQLEQPPCVSEHGQFMAPYEMVRTLNHPYAENSKAHQHLLPTPYRYAPYSAAANPFHWMLRESAEEIVKNLDLGYQPELEAFADKTMGFPTSWVQEKDNQLVMLETFYSAIQPKKSLVFFYAKRIPLIEDNRRILIGIGWVTDVGIPIEYKYKEAGPLKSMLWERNIQHSIRSDFKDGFLLPYHDVEKYLNEHPEEDPAKYVAFVPDEQFLAFSFGSEHVTNDGAIGSLLSCVKALQNIKKIIPGPWEQVLEWLDSRLNQLWEMRGPCPGLGSALTAFGLEHGSLIAYELERIMSEKPETIGGDPWLLVDRLFKQPEYFAPEISKLVGRTIQKLWVSISDERRALLKLLSRFELSAPQASRYFIHEEKQRSEFRINTTDTELLANPYRLYELDRFTPDPINLSVIDRGVFSDECLRQKFPLPKQSQIADALDPRRVCAFVIRQLDLASNNGHTLRPRELIIQEIRELDVIPACPINGDLMTMIEPAFKPRVAVLNLNNKSIIYQLGEFFTYGEKIRSTVIKRIGGVRHTTKENWEQRLNEVLKTKVEPGDDDEISARVEKVAALEELFSSRFSVLIGPAGTGKTTLLKVLCQEPLVKAGNILLLAPTGKARVRMETQTEIKGAQTIAQFLLPIDRYEPQTGKYRFSSTDPGINSYKTVIIDEASMLTEEQLAAVFDGVRGVDRFVLVGDPRQLPPIGAGRPFLDIVQKLTPENSDSIFPHVGSGYAELTIRRRQKGSSRDDLLLAEWFSGRPLDPGADEIWQRINENNISENLNFVSWDYPEELQEKLIETLVIELKLQGKDDCKSFEISLGGSEYNDNVFFWMTKNERTGACKKIEDWEILSPVRGQSFGVEAINRLIQSTFRAKTKNWALTSNYKNRKIPKPKGREQIIYGDKVIQTKNERNYYVYPKDGALQYVANGELGIVVGQYKTQFMKSIPDKLQIEFSSQPGYAYTYSNRAFSEDANPILELAYALTVHKTQGSEFGLTFVIIPNPCRLLSRELLYTALTRQRNRIIVFHQGPINQIKNYSQDSYSESAARLTNLFTEPEPVFVNEKFLEDKLIHRTGRGLCVRSKSEVIIATELDHAGIEYVYDSELMGQEGIPRYPDFVIDDADSGKQFYWEHLGMLNNQEYRNRWERKLKWYRNQGILPVEEGGGPNGTLLTTSDHLNGGIDVVEIQGLINKYFV